MHNLLGFWLRWSYSALFFLLPWSVEVPYGVFTMNMPAEPLMVICNLLLFGYLVCPKTQSHKFQYLLGNLVASCRRNHWRLAVSWRNPVLISFLGLLWAAFSAACSSMPLVSWKYWGVEATHWWLFAFGMALMPGLWQRVLPWFGTSMAIFVIYALIHHSQYHFRIDQSILAPMPFFPEHTLYAAVLAMLLPWSTYIARKLSPFEQSPLKQPNKIGRWAQAHFLTPVYGFGLWFAFCRAAWLSIAAAGGAILLLYYLRDVGKQISCTILAGLVASFFLLLFVPASISSNFKEDTSIMERLNRYDCAKQMAGARPMAGFGPGTFQFQYLPFQRRENITRISTLVPLMERTPDTFGRGGGAHSEYLQTLAETGWPGVVLHFVLVGTVLFGFSKWYEKTRDWTILLGLFGLLTFYAHGVVNNFLHDGRIAALVLGTIGHYSGLFARQPPVQGP